MYVCLCKGITDHQIRAAVSEGNNTIRALRESLGVSSQCGKCARLTKEIVREQARSLDDSLYYPA